MTINFVFNACLYVFNASKLNLTNIHINEILKYLYICIYDCTLLLSYIINYDLIWVPLLVYCRMLSTCFMHDTYSKNHN